MTTVYSLCHEYVADDGAEEFKELGLYSTRENAQAAILRYSDKEGFRDHLDGFRILETELDVDAAWATGFFRPDPNDPTGELEDIECSNSGAKPN